MKTMRNEYRDLKKENDLIFSTLAEYDRDTITEIIGVVDNTRGIGYEIELIRKDLIAIQKVAAFVDLHETANHIHADNRLAPNPQDRDFSPIHKAAEGVASNAGIVGSFFNRHADLTKARRLNSGVSFCMSTPGSPGRNIRITNRRI